MMILERLEQAAVVIGGGHFECCTNLGTSNESLCNDRDPMKRTLFCSRSTRYLYVKDPTLKDNVFSLPVPLVGGSVSTRRINQRVDDELMMNYTTFRGNSKELCVVLRQTLSYRDTPTIETESLGGSIVQVHTGIPLNVAASTDDDDDLGTLVNDAQNARDGQDDDGCYR
jgi:hypothetical protein